MLRRLLLTIAVLGAFLAVPVGPAHAQYQPGQCSFIVDPPVVEPGGDATVIGNGAPRGSTVTVSIDGTLIGSGVASDDETGSFTIPIVAPADAGDYVLTVTCGGITVTQILQVLQSTCLFAITGAPGAQVTASAPGFKIGTPYTLIFRSDPVKVGEGTVTADPQTLTFTIPSFAAPGEHMLTVAGTGTNGQAKVLDCAVTVVPGAISSVALPRTGSESGQLLRAGALMLAAGGLLVLVARRSSATD